MTIEEIREYRENEKRGNAAYYERLKIEADAMRESALRISAELNKIYVSCAAHAFRIGTNSHVPMMPSAYYDQLTACKQIPQTGGKLSGLLGGWV